MRGRTLLAAAAAVLALAGCASSPDAELNTALSNVTDAANAKDAARLRAAAGDLVNVVNRQSGSNLSAAEAKRIRALAQKVAADADLFEAAGTPAPTASLTSTPTPVVTTTPPRTYTRSPTPDPTTYSPRPTTAPPTTTLTTEPTQTPTTAPPTTTRSATPTVTASSRSGVGGAGTSTKQPGTTTAPGAALTRTPSR